MRTRTTNTRMLAMTVVAVLLAAGATIIGGRIAPAEAGTSTFSGTVDAAGVRWKGFTVSLNPGTVTVRLDWTSGTADLNPFLQTAANETLAYGQSTTARPETITYTITTAGTYKVAARAITGASGFTINVDNPDPVVNGTDWPAFHNTPDHAGVSPDTVVRSSNASGLTVQWQSNTGSPAYGSPAVVYDTTLNKQVVYVGNQSGTFGAYDAKTGDRLWYHKMGASVQSSPAVLNGVVYVGASDDKLYALNATTGAQLCTFNSGGVFSSSPVLGNPDGQGMVVYIGDNGLSGADDGGHLWAINAVDPNPAADCSVKWMFDGYSSPKSGTWSPPAYALDVNGRPLVVFGGSSPDNAAYAVDGRTGVQVWRFQSQVFAPDDDIGAGPTISAPGVNGFADGVAYIAGKDKIVYALNLRTGAKIWQFNIYQDAAGIPAATRATPSLVGTHLYIGHGKGVYKLDAITGAKVWRTDQVGPATAEVLSSTAVSGPAGDQVMLAGDVAGGFFAWDLQTGAQRFAYRTSSFIFSSPAVVGGQVYVAGGDGFLYAFGFGGAFPTAKPSTTITQPTSSASLPNTGSVRVAGMAADDTGVQQVLVAVRDVNTDKWYDASRRVWGPIFTQNPVPVASPPATSAPWSLDVPVEPSGGPYYAQAEAVDVDGQHDSIVASVSFDVASLTNPPGTTITSPTFAQVFNFPAGSFPRFPITVSGTSVDTAGANPGVARAYIVIKNIEHGEYYCGRPACSGGATGEHTDFTPTYTTLPISLNSPGAARTSWSITFNVYDHPHKYRLTAWAVDNDGNVESTRAIVGRICVNDAGNAACQ